MDSSIYRTQHNSRYWIEARAGLKTTELFAKVTKTAVPWSKASQYIRWFTDGEKRYAQQLWQMASVNIKATEVSREYGHHKVWRYGLEVAIKIKGSHGNHPVEWVKPEHPYTAISDKSDVHANHNEANNSALRRRCSAYRRRQNLYAKNTEGLQRAVTVQRLVHNWVRPHGGLGKNKTPVMAI
ncbi:MAG: IS1 family transposase, partial [Pseudanabaena sp. M38BS1SP1A06MG]|nr:IS1 family transposase [Pseudanabaena sp. M38BS1SP1A06MG]